MAFTEVWGFNTHLGIDREVAAVSLHPDNGGLIQSSRCVIIICHCIGQRLNHLCIYDQFAMWNIKDESIFFEFSGWPGLRIR